MLRSVESALRRTSSSTFSHLFRRSLSSESSSDGKTTPKGSNLSDEEIKVLTKRTQEGGKEVVEAKAGKSSATLPMTDDELSIMHEQWMAEHGRVYLTSREKRKRFKIFKANLELVNSHNSAQDSFPSPCTLCMNEFADQTSKELNAPHLNGFDYKRPSRPSRSRSSSLKRFRYKNAALVPSNMAWINKGAVTPMKDMGNCGMGPRIQYFAKYCTNATVNMISNPVNSMVPIAAEVFKKAGMYNEKKLFDVTTLGVVRAQTFYAGKAKVPVAEVNAPGIGGHAGITILPLFSQASPKGSNLSDEEIKAPTKQTQKGGMEVVGSATSSRYAGATFADACLKGLNGVPDIVERSFVQSTITKLPFFASKVRLGKNRVEDGLGLGRLSDYEKQGLESLKPELKASIMKGIKFAREN